MQKRIVVLTSICLLASLVIIGCGTKKAESGKAAIDVSKGMATAEEKVDYLMAQAQAFYKSKEFQDAIDITQYVLRYLDRESVEAANLFKQAKKDLAAQAQGTLDSLKKGLGK